MNFMGNLLSSVTGFYRDINPSTLSGTSDIIVVENEQGELSSTPFHVRFGKLTVLRPQDRLVSVYVNDVLVENLHMRVGESGLTYVEQDDDVSSDSESAHTTESTALPPHTSTTPLEHPAPFFSLQNPHDVEETTVADFIDSPEYIDWKLPHVSADLLCSYLCSFFSRTRQNFPTFAISLCGEESASLGACKTGAIERLFELRRVSSLAGTLPDLAAGDTRHLVVLLGDTMLSWDRFTRLLAAAAIAQKNLTLEHVLQILHHDQTTGPREEQLVPVSPQMHPHSMCTISAPVDAFRRPRELIDWQFEAQSPTIEQNLEGPPAMIKKGGNALEGSSPQLATRSWLWWRRSDDAARAASAKIETAIPIDENNQKSETVDADNTSAGFITPLPLGKQLPEGGADEMLNNTMLDSADLIDMTDRSGEVGMLDSIGLPLMSPSVEFGTQEGIETGLKDAKEAVAELVGGPVYDGKALFEGGHDGIGESVAEGKGRKRSQRLTSEQLRRFGLRAGCNKVSFVVDDRVKGRAVCTANVYLWRREERIVVSDIDGTITKSDTLGHVFAMVGKDWTQSGVAELYTAIARNGYRFVYLTHRAIGQSGSTRGYLSSVAQGRHTLPSGPVVLSPERLFATLHTEIIARRPDIFKTAYLRDVLRAFSPRCGPKNPISQLNPLYAAFGNRLTDFLSYKAAGIPSERLFNVNPSGEVCLWSLGQAKMLSFASLKELVDLMFPPLPINPLPPARPRSLQPDAHSITK